MAITQTGRNGAAMKQLWWIGIALVTLGVSRGVTGQALVDPERLEATLREGFSKQRSYLQQIQKEETRQYITNFFKELNASNFERQNFSGQLRNQVTANGSNLIWLLPGQRFGTAEDAGIVIGAHYDTVVNTTGVDDNGSGMAVLLEVAKALSQQTKYHCTRLNSVAFVAFDFEENGYLGSHQFVDDYLVPSYLSLHGITPEKFQGAIILETLMNWDDTPNSQRMPDGFEMLFPDLAAKLKSRQQRGDFLFTAVRQDDTSLAMKLKEQWASMPNSTKYGLNQVVLPFAGRPSGSPYSALVDMFRSDHYSFWNHQSNYSQNGLKAVFVTDTAEFRGYMKNCYHNSCDDVSHITEERLTFLAKIAEVVARVALEKATEKDDLQCTGAPDVVAGEALEKTTEKDDLESTGAPGSVAGGVRLGDQYHVTLLAILIGCWVFGN